MSNEFKLQTLSLRFTINVAVLLLAFEFLMTIFFGHNGVGGSTDLIVLAGSVEYILFIDLYAQGITYVG